MRSQAFAGLLKDFSSVLAVSHAREAAAAWLLLADLFENHSTLDASRVCNAISQSTSGTPGDTTTSDVIETITRLNDFLRPVGTNATLKDFETLKQALENARGFSIADIVEQSSARLVATSNKPKPKSMLNQATIDRHLASLNSALGDEAAFKRAVAALKGDPTAKGPELKVMARTFAGESAKTKGKALEFIENHHKSLMESRDKNAAIGGRTAA